jgi:hypothetical protein
MRWWESQYKAEVREPGFLFQVTPQAGAEQKPSASSLPCLSVMPYCFQCWSVMHSNTDPGLIISFTSLGLSTDLEAIIAILSGEDRGTHKGHGGAGQTICPFHWDTSPDLGSGTERGMNIDLSI